MKAVIALGANIGDPKAQMDLAVAMLREATEVISVSEYFSTKPVRCPALLRPVLSRIWDSELGLIRP